VIPSTASSVERELLIEASPAAVWRLLTDPACSTSWWGRTLSFDPRPGGGYRIEVVPGHVASGTFVELLAPHRLVYTWGWEPDGDGPNRVPAGSTTVEIELAPSGSGTRLRFAHRGLPDDDAATSHARGWDHYLPRLAEAAAHGDAGPDPWAGGGKEGAARS
jgi:uncharacterized protein YndB with AHSA1/START domain